MKKDLIEQYEYAANQLLKFFISKYFGKLSNKDYYWVGKQTGGVAHINDYYFDLLEMIEYLKNSATRKMMFDYYDYALNEEEQDRTPLPFRHYKKNLRNK